MLIHVTVYYLHYEADMVHVCRFQLHFIFLQYSDYVNTLLVPKEGEIPVDIEQLASQGIFDVVCASIFLSKAFEFLLFLYFCRTFSLVFMSLGKTLELHFAWLT